MPTSQSTSSHQLLSSAMSDLATRVPDLVAECAELCAAAVPELADRDLEPTLLASCEANISTMISMLQTGEPVGVGQVPPGALALARELVHLGAEPDAIVRAYRVGHSWFQDVIVGELSRRADGVEELRVAMAPAVHWLFTYIDAVCDQLTEEYEAERLRWLPTAAAVRSAVIRALVGGRHDDLDGASLTLGYELRRAHVAVIAWTEDPGCDVHGALARLLDGASSARPLLHTASATSAWAWLPVDDVPELAPPPDGIWVTTGSPMSGPEGFQTSHTEALDARRIVDLLRREAGSVTAFHEVEWIALASDDLPRVERFVHRELGELAAATAPAQRLRETVLAAFEEDSLADAADRLSVHYNTVVYRLKRAEELLGRPVTRNQLRLQTALQLAPIVGLSDRA